MSMRVESTSSISGAMSSLPPPPPPPSAAAASALTVPGLHGSSSSSNLHRSSSRLSLDAYFASPYQSSTFPPQQTSHPLTLAGRQVSDTMLSVRENMLISPKVSGVTGESSTSTTHLLLSLLSKVMKIEEQNRRLETRLFELEVRERRNNNSAMLTPSLTPSLTALPHNASSLSSTYAAPLTPADRVTDTYTASPMATAARSLSTTAAATSSTTAPSASSTSPSTCMDILTAKIEPDVPSPVLASFPSIQSYPQLPNLIPSPMPMPLPLTFPSPINLPTTSTPGISHMSSNHGPIPMSLSQSSSSQTSTQHHSSSSSDNTSPSSRHYVVQPLTTEDRVAFQLHIQQQRAEHAAAQQLLEAHAQQQAQQQQQQQHQHEAEISPTHLTTKTETATPTRRGSKRRSELLQQKQQQQQQEQEQQQQIKQEEETPPTDENNGAPRKRARRMKRSLREAQFIPKKPKTAYNYFQSSVRKQIQNEVNHNDPHLTREEKSQQVARIIGERWKNLPEAKRAPFQVCADRDKERYKSDLEKSVMNQLSKRQSLYPVLSITVPTTAQQYLVAHDTPLEWNNDDVCGFLESLELSHLIEPFRIQQINGRTFLHLSAAEMQHTLGIVTLGERKLLQTCIADLRRAAENHALIMSSQALQAQQQSQQHQQQQKRNPLILPESASSNSLISLGTASDWDGDEDEQGM